MDLHADALGLTRLRDFHWNPMSRGPTGASPASNAQATPVEKREAKRQRHWPSAKPRRKRDARHGGNRPAVNPDPAGQGRGLLSWTQCPVPDGGGQS